MWKWSKSVQEHPYQGKNSLLNAYDELASVNLPAHFIRENDCKKPRTDGNYIDSMQQKLNDLLAYYQLKNMYLISKDYTPQTWCEMSLAFQEYQRVRIAFLKFIAYSRPEICSQLNFHSQEIELLKNGITPENYNTHLKIPFDFGGNLDFSNFSLIKTHHTHSNIHRILDYQIACGFLLQHHKIFIPFFEGEIYVE